MALNGVLLSHPRIERILLVSPLSTTDSFGLNATVRYTANFSNAQVPDVDNGANVAVPASQSYDMSWNRLEAFLGVRWFM